MEPLNVNCRQFERTLNCSNRSLPKDIKDACCSEDPPRESSRQFYFSKLMKCCEVLEDNGYGRTEDQDWENGSYQAYVMGVAVFAILICLFVSGARSIRRRRMLLRARLHQQVTSDGPDNLPQINTQISLGPPTYGELEASGLTKDFKMGVFDPPAYPGTLEDFGEDITPPGDQESGRTPSSRRDSKSETMPSQNEANHRKGETTVDVETEFVRSSTEDVPAS